MPRQKYLFGHLLNSKTYRFLAHLQKQKGKIEVDQLKDHLALFAKCAMLVINGVIMEDVASDYELGIPRSVINISGELYPGHEGKAHLMHAVKVSTTTTTEGGVLNEVVSTSLQEIALEVLGTNVRRGKRIAVVDAMVVVKQLSPKSAWLPTCLDLSRIFISRVKALTKCYAKVTVVVDAYDNCD